VLHVMVPPPWYFSLARGRGVFVSSWILSFFRLPISSLLPSLTSPHFLAHFFLLPAPPQRVTPRPSALVNFRDHGFFFPFPFFLSRPVGIFTSTKPDSCFSRPPLLSGKAPNPGGSIGLGEYRAQTSLCPLDISPSTLFSAGIAPNRLFEGSFFGHPPLFFSRPFFEFLEPRPIVSLRVAFGRKRASPLYDFSANPSF